MNQKFAPINLAARFGDASSSEEEDDKPSSPILYSKIRIYKGSGYMRYRTPSPIRRKNDKYKKDNYRDERKREYTKDKNFDKKDFRFKK